MRYLIAITVLVLMLLTLSGTACSGDTGDFDSVQDTVPDVENASVEMPAEKAEATDSITQAAADTTENRFVTDTVSEWDGYFLDEQSLMQSLDNYTENANRDWTVVPWRNIRTTKLTI